MPNTDPNMDLSANEIESITKLLEHEYFKLRVEQEVRLRTQSELDTWWKRLVAIAAVVATIIGLLGIREYFSFRNMISDEKAILEKDRTELRQKNDNDRKEAKDRAERSDALIAQKASVLDGKEQEVSDVLSASKVEVSKLEATASGIKEQYQTNNALISSLTRQSSADQVAYAKGFAEQATTLKLKAQEVEGLQAALGESLRNNDKKLTEFKDGEAARQKQVDERMADVALMKSDVEGVKNRLYGALAYVLEEKIDNLITVLLGDPQNGGREELIKIHVYRVHERELIGFQVRDKNDKILVPERKLHIKSSVPFEAYGYAFVVNLKYITELPFRSDQAGIDLRWARVTTPPTPIARN